MVSTPRFAWLGAKQYKQSGDSRKNRSGHGPEHSQAIVENASRGFAKEVNKALAPSPEHVAAVKAELNAHEVGLSSDQLDPASIITVEDAYEAATTPVGSSKRK